MTTDAATRLLSPDLLTHPLDASEDAGPLATRQTEILGGLAGTEVGVGLWQAEPGTDTDIEVDEVFLVLEGAGVVEFADGSTIELKPGVLVRLLAGDETVWRITERLRKLYLA